MGEGDPAFLKHFKTFFQANSMSWQQFMWKNIFLTKPVPCSPNAHAQAYR